MPSPKRLAAVSILAGLALAAVARAVPQAAAPDDDPRLGRWDLTAQEGEVTYPLWLELVEDEGRLAGRFQPRFGHAVPIVADSLGTDGIAFRAEGTRYTGRLEDERWTGTAETEDGVRIAWTGVRAPALRRPSGLRWGSPRPLFDGASLAGWRVRDPSLPSYWRARDGVLENTGEGTDLLTEGRFMDFRLHIEVNVPPGGNSGIYLRGRYEVQVQDDAGVPPDSRRMGGIYGHLAPRINAARPAGTWQTYDITLLGRSVTVVLNGETILENEEIPGITGGALDSNEAEPGPILLQGDHGPVSYRNIVLTPAAP